jgi:hypothetical protein
MSIEINTPTRFRPGHEERVEQRREARRYQRVVQASLDAIERATEDNEHTDDESIVRSSHREQRRLLRRIDEYCVPNVSILRGHALFNTENIDYAALTETTIKSIVAEMIKQMYKIAIARVRLDTGDHSEGRWVPTIDGVEFVNEHVESRLYRNNFMKQSISILIDISNVEFSDIDNDDAIKYIINWCRFENLQYRLTPPRQNHAFETLIQQTIVADIMKPLNIDVVVRPVQPENVAMTCGICFDDDVRVNDSAIITACNHVLCSGCVSGTARARGIKSFILCPYCRTEISTLSVASHAEYNVVVAGLAPIN